MPKDPVQSADKWARNLANAQPDIIAGIDRVRESPGVAAVRQKAKMVQNWNASVVDGTWEQNTGAVTLSSWQNDFKTKGVPRIAPGAQAAKGKMADFLRVLI